ncbi:MAG: hypothetical protein II943_08555 [Victivallales bacterium]|nr:hypothetical protein [Victivallales bacterium]
MNWQKALGVFFGVAVLSVGLTAQEAVTVDEEEGGWKPSLELSADYSSVYISKGNVSNPDPILTLDAKIGLKGFYVDVTSMFDMSGYNSPERSGSYTNNRKWRAEEIDYVLGYAYTFDKELLGGFSDLTVDFSWQYYQYPRFREEQGEEDEDGEIEGSHLSHFKEMPLCLTLSLDNVLASFTEADSPHKLSLSNNLYYDLAQYYWYTETSVGYEYKISEKLAASLTNTWYWGDGKFNGWGKQAMKATDLVAELAYDICDNVTLGAYVGVAWATNSHERQEWKDDANNNRTNWWGGVKCTFAF